MTKLPLSVYPAKVLIQLVREMRQAQIAYFRNKGAPDLLWAKKVEQKVDRLLFAIDETKVEASAEWGQERKLALIMGIRDEAQWLYALEDLATGKSDDDQV